jgi:hypothetical protein
MTVNRRPRPNGRHGAPIGRFALQAGKTSDAFFLTHPSDVPLLANNKPVKWNIGRSNYPTPLLVNFL